MWCMSVAQLIAPGDIDTINTELMLADLESVEKRVKKSEKIVKSSKDQSSNKSMT
ncbi:MAG: hypothetical protein R2827_07135 [Bdellovibrionales bacterium]